jgi:predicted DNA-binding transcriptional regulator YafY
MDRLERLVNLVAALIETPRPLTRADIAERIEGYSSEPEAFRRNFERDKELLRQMGFPVVTQASDPAHPEEVGYRIPRELYELPDPGLDDSELAALRLAASAVQVEGEWGGEAMMQALRKLGGAVDGSLAGSLAGRASGLAALPGEAAAAVAFSAIADRRQLRFSYRGEERLVDPWRLSFHRGHWYLAGLDHSRSGERLFRLDRLDGPAEAHGPAGSFNRPEGFSAGPPPPWRLGDEDEQTARLLVDAGQAFWARQSLGEPAAARADGSVEFDVPVTNWEGFRSFVLGFLDHAVILAPPELRARMVEWLEAVP